MSVAYRCLLAAGLLVGVLGGGVANAASMTAQLHGSRVVGAAAAPVMLTGDLDCSGVVDARDALAGLQLDAGLRGSRGLCTTAGDVNEDGRLNPLDSLLILEYVAGEIEVLA